MTKNHSLCTRLKAWLISVSSFSPLVSYVPFNASFRRVPPLGSQVDGQCIFWGKLSLVRLILRLKNYTMPFTIHFHRMKKFIVGRPYYQKPAAQFDRRNK